MHERRSFRYEFMCIVLQINNSAYRLIEWSWVGYGGGRNRSAALTALISYNRVEIVARVARLVRNKPNFRFIIIRKYIVNFWNDNISQFPQRKQDRRIGITCAARRPQIVGNVIRASGQLMRELRHRHRIAAMNLVMASQTRSSHCDE